MLVALTLKRFSRFYYYKGADKSLARLWKETSYGDQDLQHYAKTYGVKTTGIYAYSCCLYAISLGRVLWVLVAVACFLISNRVYFLTWAPQHFITKELLLFLQGEMEYRLYPKKLAILHVCVF